MSVKKTAQKSSTVIGDNNVVISGNVIGSTIVTGDSNTISTNQPYEENLLQRVREELEAEGENERAILNMTEDALYLLTNRIAQRLRRTFDNIWEALRVLGGG